MKNFRFAIAVMVVLMLAALGSWSWYFLTAQKNANRFRARIQRLPRQAMPVPKHRAATQVERQGVATAIRAQLEAFKKEDYKSAMIYQSKELRKNFGSLEEFRAMMRRNYPQFTRYKKVQFGKSLAVGEGKDIHFIVPVSLTGKDGIKVQATYMMVKEGGQYRVASVLGGSVLGGSAPHAPRENPRDPFSDFDAPPPLET